MTALSEVLETTLLQQMIEQRCVRQQVHPDRALRILNYTDKAQGERIWNGVTRVCRGLVIDEHDEIVAWPLRKFFEYGDPAGPTIDLDEPVVVTDKLDGALGVLVPLGGGEFTVATRGSFTSEPARHATQVWQQRYAGRWAPPEGMTALFEIIYPGWRIILDYGSLDELVLLGFVDTATGRTFSPTDTHGWPGPAAEVFPYESFAAAMAAEPREGAEGLVVHFQRSDERLKLKQDDYAALHRLFFRCTVRRLWAHLAANACQHLIREDKQWAQFLRMDPENAHRVLAAGPNWMDRYVDRVPQEFAAWVKQRCADIAQQVDDLRAAVIAEYASYLPLTPADQHAFSVLTFDSPHRKFLMELFYGKGIETMLWKWVRPAHEIPFLAVSEDVA